MKGDQDTSVQRPVCQLAMTELGQWLARLSSSPGGWGGAPHFPWPRACLLWQREHRSGAQAAIPAAGTRLAPTQAQRISLHRPWPYAVSAKSLKARSCGNSWCPLFGINTVIMLDKLLGLTSWKMQTASWMRKCENTVWEEPANTSLMLVGQRPFGRIRSFRDHDLASWVGRSKGLGQ